MSSSTHKNSSILGGILLVVGNVVGGAILALPIATAQLGLLYAILILLGSWMIMTLGAYYFLEANLALPSGSNLISMSRITLGKWGSSVAWVCNSLLMYSLISAYLSGGGDLITTNLHYLGITIPAWLSPVLFLGIFGYIVSRGIHLTDYTNRILMTFKAVIFFIVVLGLANYFNIHMISIIPEKTISASLLIIVVTSFGFASLVPSLRHYYQSDIKKVKKVIFLGTSIPLICYIIWITLIFPIIPYHGEHGLESMSVSTHPVSDLQTALSQALHISWLTQATNIFSAICIVTSFLANSISFTDFIVDGLHLNKNNKKSSAVYFIAFLPPLCSVLFYQKAFLLGLSIAGTLAIIQALILPGLMVWFLRYSGKHNKISYSVMGGKPFLIGLLTVSFALLIFTLF